MQTEVIKTSFHNNNNDSLGNMDRLETAQQDKIRKPTMVSILQS